MIVWLDSLGFEFALHPIAGKLNSIARIYSSILFPFVQCVCNHATEPLLLMYLEMDHDTIEVGDAADGPHIK